MRVEYSNIKVSPFKQATLKAIGGMSNLAPSVVNAEAPLRVSPVMGCRVGSMQTSLQTSESQLPTVSRTSLLDVGKATFGAGERVVHGKMCPTGTIVEDVGGLPTVPQSESIPESSLAE